MMLTPESIGDETFETLARLYPPKEIVEIVLTAAFYLCLATFTRATLRFLH